MLVRLSMFHLFFIAHLCNLGAEGGADSWARPPLPPLNEERDKIGATISLFLRMMNLRWPLVFQQIDVETASDPNGKIILRMFGVTEVVILRSSTTLELMAPKIRMGIVCWQISPIFNLISMLHFLVASQKMISVLSVIT